MIYVKKEGDTEMLREVEHPNVKVAERELEELKLVGQALNSEVNHLEYWWVFVHLKILHL